MSYTVVTKLSYDRPSKKYHIVREFLGNGLYMDHQETFGTQESAQEYINSLESVVDVEPVYTCEQCHRKMNPVDYIVGPVCKRCCDKNRARVCRVRMIDDIAHEIIKSWPNVHYSAVPYLRAMLSLETINDSYGLESADMIIRYFLENAKTWRGETARRIKYELKSLLRSR